MKLLVAIFALFPVCAFATTDSQFGVGLGTRYGGILGLNYSLSGELDKFYIGAGRADLFRKDEPESYGLTLGWERAMNENHALGFAFRTRTINGEGLYYPAGYFGLEESTEKKDGYETSLFGTYTYYFSGTNQSGFLTGANIGKSYYKDNVRSDYKDGVAIGLHFGYQF
ncbi:hypothetical protein [Microbulbifer sp.]|uniref:hypothetical protein n=1 Tax=Microbulbifer sp. TaxID=1908541 RepID=UPI002F93BBA3